MIVRGSSSTPGGPAMPPSSSSTGSPTSVAHMSGDSNGGSRGRGLKRGAFVLLEGVDRCGKTTQCSLLLQRLLSLSVAAVAFRFPDRTTSVGQLIDGYLRSGNDLDDRAIHLLFSANRWEASKTLTKALAEGTTVVCDRYAYSGVAFSSAKLVDEGGDDGKDEDKKKEEEEEHLLSVDWCKGPDVGLPAPDVVIFLDLSQNEAEKRGGYGGERYEKRSMQKRVRARFAELQGTDEAQGRIPWHVVDASGSIQDVQRTINAIVDDTLESIREDGGAPLRKMWEEGEYVLPAPSSSSSSSPVVPKAVSEEGDCEQDAAEEIGPNMVE